MWGFKMKKRILLSILLSSTLILQGDSNLNSLITTYKSDAGSWTSPSTGTKYHYGGSYQFTFNGGNRVQPWVTVGEPEFKVGCNGISLKGGFVGLLGLNEIKDQLRDASTSLAWGALIALQYATPALFQVFIEVRGWASTIQRMLQNACQIGTMLVASNNDARKGYSDVFNFLGNNAATDTLQTGMEGSSRWRESIDKFTNCSSMSNQMDPATGKSPAGECMKSLSSDKESPQGAANVNRVATAGLLGKRLTAPTTSTNTLKIANLSSLFKTGKIDNVTVASGTQLTEMVNTIKIMRVFFGDLALSEQSYIDKVAKDTTAYSKSNLKAFTEGSYNIDTAQVNKRLKQDTEGHGENSADSPIKYKHIPAVISDPSKAAKALLYGITSSTNTAKCQEGSCYMEDGIIYYYDFDGKNDKRTLLLGIVEKPSSSQTSDLELKWEGAYKESLKSIRSIAKARSGITPTNTTIYDSATVDSSSVSSTIPLLVPNIDRYLDIITRLEKSANAETAMSTHLKTILAQQNAQVVAENMLSLLYGKIMDMNDSTGSVQELAEFNKSLNLRKDEISKELAMIKKEGVDIKSLNDIFITIEQELQNSKVRQF